MLRRERGHIDLASDLQGVAPVDEDRGAVGKHDCHPRRSSEAGQPRKPLRRGRQVFALVLVGVGNDEAAETGCRQCLAEFLQAIGRCVLRHPSLLEMPRPGDNDSDGRVVVDLRQCNNIMTQCNIRTTAMPLPAFRRMRVAGT